MSELDPRAFLDKFASEARARGFEAETLMETAAGPLVAFTGPENGPPAYLSAGIHGDEPAGPLAALHLLESGALDSGHTWTICPVLNPTGLLAGTRCNTDGKDLNRDYLRCESPEITAHVAWLRRQAIPRLFLSLHEDWESTGYYFYEINLGADKPERARDILAAVAPWFPPEPYDIIDNHQVRELGWIYHEASPDFPDHWPEAIFLSDRGCPVSFTLEAPSSMKLADRVAAHCAAARKILEWMGE